MLITKTETHVVLEKESELETFYLGKLAGLIPASNLKIEDGIHFQLIVPEKDFTNTLIALLEKN